ncbi:MAG: hypothetical protein ACRENX_13095 [Candidatus Dormibacteria bacterium]
MSSRPSLSDGEGARPEAVIAPTFSGSGDQFAAPFELPVEQAMVLASVPRQGIPESQLDHILGMTSADAARIKAVLLRRRLVRRTPAGKHRASSRLELTDRGEQGLRWLDQLQTSLPSDLFAPAEPLPPGPLRLVDGFSVEVRPTPAPRGLFARLHALWTDQPEPAVTDAAAPEEVFGWGFINVALGTGCFGVAALVGILLQNERDALTALGVGCLLAAFFFIRAGAALFRHARVRSWLARRLRRIGEDRVPAWPRHRPRSRRAVE